MNLRPVIVLVAILAAFVVTGVGPARAEPAAPAPQGESEPAGSALTRAEARSFIAEWRKIVSPNGVEELLEIPIGGTRQWISVRGRDRRNPILLMIHGGPASPEMPVSWAFQNGWEDYFTVVQWDQRGSGKSYNANDPGVIGPTLSLERITADAAEVVQYLSRRYDKHKVFVLGHSWGSVVGISLARQHPELLHAYIGMGQLINGKENERQGYAWTIASAKARGNDAAIKELESISPYPEPDGAVPLEKINIERKWSVKFGGLSYNRDGLGYYFNLMNFSPEYTDNDLAAIDRGSQLSLPGLLHEFTGFDFMDVTEFDCPILLFEGRHDHTTPSEIAAAWLEDVEAPSKKLVWFEHSAHMIMMEEPGRVLVHLVQDVLPLAASAASAAKLESAP